MGVHGAIDGNDKQATGKGKGGPIETVLTQTGGYGPALSVISQCTMGQLGLSM